MDKKQKILIVHNYYQIPGGEDTVVANEKKLLEDNGHEVVLYTRHNSELKTQNKFKKILLPFTSIFSFKTYFDIKKTIKSENIDVVHVHNTLTLISPAVYCASLKCKKPVIQTIHNFRLLCPAATFYRNGNICEDCLSKGLKCAVEHSCYRNSKLQTLLCVINTKIHRLTGIYKKINYICLTDFNKEKLLQHGQIKENQIFVKPNFINSELDVIPYKERENQFVCVGRLEKLKGTDILLKLWKNIGQNTTKLIMCGTGELEQWAKDFVLENKLNVEFKGFVPNEETKKLIANSKALILCSQLYEGFPMTIAESFAVGTPVIGSNIGNVGNLIVENENGFKFENEQELKSILETKLKDFNGLDEKWVNKYSQTENYKILKEIYLLDWCVKNSLNKSGSMYMKKIAFFVQHLICGGVENALISLVSELVKDDYEITIFTINKTGEFLDRVPKQVKVKEIEIPVKTRKVLPVGGIKLALKENFKNKKFFNCFKLIKNRLYFNTGFSELDIDFEKIPKVETEFDFAVNYHMHSPFLVRYLAEKITAKTKYTWIHNDFTTTNYKIQKLQKYLKCNSRFFAVSNKLKDEFINIFPEYKNKTELMLNIVPTQQIIEKSNENIKIEFDNILDDTVKILSVGRLEEQKGYDLTIEVAALLNKDKIKFEWLILGEGSLRKELEKLIVKNNLQNQVKLLGIKTNPYPYFKKCDIYVQTSRHEGYATTVTEAKIFAKPIICTDVAGAKEQINDGENGYVVDINSNSIYEKLISLIKNKKMRQKISKTANENNYIKNYDVSIFK